MINKRTLRILNDIGFGIDIDSLESYVLDFEKAKNVADLSKYEFNYELLKGVLKEVKPNSIALKKRQSNSEIEKDQWDFYFDKLGNERTPKIYGQRGIKKIQSIKNLIFSSENDAFDIVSIPSIEGINITCLYYNGDFCRVTAISEASKQYDITDLFEDKFPKHINLLEDYELVELRATATILKADLNRYNSSNISVNIMHTIRTGINHENIEFIYHDIFTDSEEEPFDTYWNKLSFIEDLGFKTVRRRLLLNIDSDAFNQALIELGKDIKDDEPTLEYIYNGLNIKKNNNADIYGYILNYDTTNTDSHAIFTSVVKSILKDNGKYYLRIVQVECNTNLSIDRIEIHDVYDIEKLGITIGKKINFKVIQGKAVLTA